MRLLFVLLLFVSAATKAQTGELCLSFSAEALSMKQKQELATFIDTQLVEQIVLLGQIAQTKDVSRNRIAMDQQLLATQQALIELSVAGGSVKVLPYELVDTIQDNKIHLSVIFKAKQGELVFKSTSKVTISDGGIIKKTLPIKRKKKEYVPSLLSYEQFKTGELVRIPNLHFQPGTAKWLNESRDAIVELYNVLKYRPNLKVALHGHVCCEWAVDGPQIIVDSYCHDLSEGRAEAIYNFLVLNGIDKSRLAYKGFGAKKKLVDDRKSADAAKLNRRVEVFVVSD